MSAGGSEAAFENRARRGWGEIPPGAASGRALAAAILSSLLALGAGCPGSNPEGKTDDGGAAAPKLAPKKEAPKQVRIPVESALHTLDPHEAGDAVSRRIVGLLYDQLVDWDPYAPPGEYQLVPELLAELPTVSEDGLTLTMKLRTGDAAAMFGTNDCVEGGSRAVKASDVKAMFLRHAAPQMRRAYSMLAGRIVGFDEYAQAQTKEETKADAKEPAITANDETGVIEVSLTRPQPELVPMLANPQMSIVPAECPEYWDGFDRLPFAGNPIGSGPYIVDQTRLRIPKSVLLVPNPAYDSSRYPTKKPGSDHPQKIPSLPVLEFEHIRSPETALRLFQHDDLAVVSPGQSQFAEVFDGETLRKDAVPEGTQVIRSPVAATTLLLFDMNDPVVGKGAKGRAIRRAVSLAFDAAKYHQIVRNGVWATPATRLVPPGVSGSHGEAFHAYAPAAADVERAKKELAKAGAKNVTLRYVTSDTEAARQEAAILEQALKAIGITLETKHEARYQELLSDPDNHLGAQVFSLRWDMDYPDAENVLRAFTCEGGLSALTHHCDRKYDAMFDEFSALPAGPERSAAIEKLERYLGDEAVARPIDHPELWMLAQPWIHNVIRHPLSGLRAELAHL
jgi:ABC-type transport system substrate-binding protein